VKLEIKSVDSKSVFKEVGDYLNRIGLDVESYDLGRPWGGFFLIDEKQIEHFANEFFPEENLSSLRIAGKLSPKLLVVGPGKRLSWQYHLRRAEIWRAISGAVDVVTSNTDIESDKITLQAGDLIRLSQGQRHRIVGSKEWGVLAEIWQHTDVENPSNENDIIRVQDDFGR
jgi:mannose-6-phosphate isomerase-like protein (cupin superfamily)